MQQKQKEYAVYVERLAEKSPLGKNIVCAFLIGGAICTLGQAIQNGWMALGMAKEEAGTLCAVSLIFLSMLLTGLSLYDDLAKIAGAGTIVPITGFANAVVSPAIEFKEEGFVTGMAAKMFTIAGPVIVYGVSASVVYGIVYWLVQKF